ncbi:CD209 antigen-like protein A [Perca fluviatilis]|uniref:CD209 antigen-like protein A n=1 Tax=Perca fluviatilis TaxID=8168 RepID=UPI001962AF32|nr:CD209 antigen-like protein A [Perca fluviatilis]
MLQTQYNQLSNNNSQLQVKVSDISINYSQLQSSYETLSVNHSHLQDEIKQLKNRTKDKSCPDGWTTFGSHCYFKSKEKKTWDGSRAICQQREADLVVINNKEEQKFVTELSKDGESWIGLLYESSQSGYKWDWVDGSPLTETFWAAGLPHYDGYRYAAKCCDQQEKWTQRRYYDNKNWICEKVFL